MLNRLLKCSAVLLTVVSMSSAAAEPYVYYPEGYAPANASQTLASASFGLTTGPTGAADQAENVDLRNRSEGSAVWSFFDSFLKGMLFFIR